MEPLLRISEFSRLSGIRRKNLIFYDEIGLLRPERVADNGYRFYSYRQLEIVNVIVALQEVGMPLSEIKRYLSERTPAALIELFTAQKKNVGEKLRRLHRIRAMIDTRLAITRGAATIDPSKLELRSCAEEFLFAGEEIPRGATPDDEEKAFEAFYELCDREKITYGYPLGTIISRQNLLSGNYRSPSRFFFKFPKAEGAQHKLSKPGGLYLTGFERAAYDGPQKIYGRLFDFMESEGLSPAGDSYEEFLLDEIAVQSRDDCLLQISIRVEKV